MFLPARMMRVFLRGRSKKISPSATYARDRRNQAQLSWKKGARLIRVVVIPGGG